eukprot:Rhum_TRINITY_DN15745_c0_g1::Rhum_TRINITY_DN15745_c0_g1_i1::g.161971::m.161971/K07583/PUS10; tRNA pseudouridine synthase 10
MGGLRELASCSTRPATAAWVAAKGETCEALDACLSYFSRELDACAACALGAMGCADADVLIECATAGPATASVCQICCGTLAGLAKLQADVLREAENWRYVDAVCFTPQVQMARSYPVRLALALKKAATAEGIAQALPTGVATAKTVAQLVSTVKVAARDVIAMAVSKVCEARGLKKDNAPSDVMIKVIVDTEVADATLADRWFAIDGNRPTSGKPPKSKYGKFRQAAHSRNTTETEMEFQAWPSANNISDRFSSLTVDQLSQLGEAYKGRAISEGTEAEAPAQFAVSSERAPLLLAGRYMKFDREMPQTPWLINGKRMGKTSLQEELMGPVLPFLFPKGIPADVTSAPAAPVSADGAPPAKRVRENESAEVIRGLGGTKFHSAGREDMDVRMFGNGRPFLLEVPNPCRKHFTDEELRATEDAVNSSDGCVEVTPGSMKLVPRQYFLDLAEASEKKQKQYRCVVWVAKEVTADLLARLEAKEFTIEQKTPIRVLHRRSALTRPKIIHLLTVADVINKHWLVLDIVTQAGTYIKEFVNGDRGRTTPSVQSLCGCPVDILQLDVTDVFCDL